MLNLFLVLNIHDKIQKYINKCFEIIDKGTCVRNIKILSQIFYILLINKIKIKMIHIIKLTFC